MSVIIIYFCVTVDPILFFIVLTRMGFLFKFRYTFYFELTQTPSIKLRSSEEKISHPTQNFILQEFIIKSGC